jgi:hypothetical protein
VTTGYVAQGRGVGIRFRDAEQLVAISRHSKLHMDAHNTCNQPTLSFTFGRHEH